VTLEEAPKTFASGDEFVVATWRNALLMMWSGAITTASLDAAEGASKLLEREFGSDQIAISITLPKIPIPDDKARAHAARLLRELGPFVKLSVTIIEGAGIWVRAGRVIITALTTIAGSKHKLFISRTIDEAVKDAQPLVTPKATIDDVARAVRAFRALK
jgi:hypothetical protein